MSTRNPPPASSFWGKESWTVALRHPDRQSGEAESINRKLQAHQEQQQKKQQSLHRIQSIRQLSGTLESIHLSVANMISQEEEEEEDEEMEMNKDLGNF